MTRANQIRNSDGMIEGSPVMRARNYFWLCTAAAVATNCLNKLAYSMTVSMVLKQ